VTKPVHAESVIKVACFQHVKTYFSATITVTITIICILAFLMLLWRYNTESLCNYTICARQRPLSL